MPTGRTIDGVKYSEITNHSKKANAKKAQKRYKNKGWDSVRVIKEGPGKYTVYGRYRK